jgi:hypothetical protein
LWACSTGPRCLNPLSMWRMSTNRNRDHLHRSLGWTGLESFLLMENPRLQTETHAYISPRFSVIYIYVPGG